MRLRLNALRFGCVFSVCLFAFAAVRAQSPDSEAFFETRIRPVLVNHCYECHSSESKELGGGLRLDHPVEMLTGGESGLAIDPGNPKGSLLVSAIRYESSEMPPAGRLPDQVIRDIEAWIAAGANDPRSRDGYSAREPSGIDLEAGRHFWAFQPIAAVDPPADGHASATGQIDRFLNRQLHQAGLTPSPVAAPLVRLRRLAFDLTGLPPSPSLQLAWLADPSRRHWIKIVDSMLASTAFAEHWARHWMDVARYADSNGSDFNATHHEAWRYRQYLIDAFAADRPWDQMIRQQIAGDLLTAATDQERYDNVVATTFLMIGTKMLSERDKAKLRLDVVDEQIDTVGRAFLGLTLGCARCHDHKFDPVPTEDYYALAGIFNSTVTLKGESQKYVSTWNRVPLPTSQAYRDSVLEYQQAVEALKDEIKAAEKELKSAHSSIHAGVIVDDKAAKKVGDWKASTYYKHFVGEGYVHDNNSNKGQASIEFSTRLPTPGKYEVRVSHSPGLNRAAEVPVTILTAKGVQKVKLDQRSFQHDPMWSSLGEFSFLADTDAVVRISNQGTNGYVIADAVQFLSADERSETVATEEIDGADRSTLEFARRRMESLKQALKALDASAPPPSPVAMAPSDRPSNELIDSRVHIRGEVNNLGESVARGFLQVFSEGGSSILNPQGSGRIELADWLTDPDNPLTSRVFVNRVWMHLFGEGLVRTVDNFGMQGERPTHPQLLDFLAARFVRNGWRLKPLVRELVLSHAYSQSSAYDENSIAIDPENRLLWRVNRRRLTAESIRDAMIAATGRLDRQPRLEPMAGRGVLVSSNEANSAASFDDLAQPCRSIYLPVVRSYVPPMLSALDAADPDLLVGRRPTTNVPTQALLLINSPVVDAWAGETSSRILDAVSGFDERLRLSYQVCLQRDLGGDDRMIAQRFFQDRIDSPQAWHQFIAALFASTEFRLLD
ncbi:MAG: DUF1553 domain-containing protein [Planctomycetota bacterium]|nr:DUF1553 domain-containing protein [Planctomycetota bacterium]